jgi:hypothetical protein
MLVQLYIFSLVLSAILLVASLFLGDTPPDVAADRELESKTPPASEIGQLDGLEPSPKRFLAITVKSVRFWTFFIAFFGMTGLILDGLNVMSPVAAFVTALATGAVVGVSANAAVRILAP